MGWRIGNESKIDLAADNKIKEISKSEIENALEQGIYVFFIDVSNDQEIQEFIYCN